MNSDKTANVASAVKPKTKIPPWMIGLFVVLGVCIVVAIVVLVIFTQPPSGFIPTFSFTSPASTSSATSSSTGSSSDRSFPASGAISVSTSYTTIDVAQFWAFTTDASTGVCTLSLPNLQAFAHSTLTDFFTSRTLPSSIRPNSQQTVNGLVGTVVGTGVDTIRAVVNTNGIIVFSNAGSEFPANPSGNLTNGPAAQSFDYDMLA